MRCRCNVRVRGPAGGECQRVANLALLNCLVVAGETGEDRQARCGGRSPPVRPRRAGYEIEDRAGVRAKPGARGVRVVRLIDPALVAHEDGRVPVFVRLDGDGWWKRVWTRLALRGVEKGHRDPRLIRRHDDEGLAVWAAEVGMQLQRSRAHEREVV